MCVSCLQRTWRKHLQKRASKALAMMVLRAKVRRAHRAAYVANLLRRKTPAPGHSSTAGGEGEGAAAGEGDADTGFASEDGETVELSAQQEAELQQALQQVLDDGQLSMADIAELQLTDLMKKLQGGQDGSGGGSITLGAGEGESDGEEVGQEEEEQQQGGWKVLSKPTAPVKVGGSRYESCSAVGARCGPSQPATWSWRLPDSSSSSYAWQTGKSKLRTTTVVTGAHLVLTSSRTGGRH